MNPSSPSAVETSTEPFLASEQILRDMKTRHGSDSDAGTDDGRTEGRDVPSELGGERAYECYVCGATCVASDSPGACPECGADMRNRGAPME